MRHNYTLDGPVVTIPNMPGRCERSLTRILARTRWPLALLAVFFFVLMIASGWISASWLVRLRDDGTVASFGIAYGALQVHYGHFVIDEDGYDRPYDFDSISDGWKHWCWTPAYESWHPSAAIESVYVPLWALSFAFGIVSIVAFRAKGREPKAGRCTNCSYPLGESSVCPECGRSAPSN